MSEMQRTNIVELKPNDIQKKVLKEAMLLSSCIYNMANYRVRQAIFNKIKVPSYYDCKKNMQFELDYKLLGRSYASPRLQIYFETNSARFKLINSKTQKSVGLPKYLKNRKTNTTIPSYLVIDNSQYSIGDNKVMIPLSNIMRKKYGVPHKMQFKINYNGILKWKGKQQRGQIHCKNNKFYLYQSVEIDTPVQKKTHVQAGIDLGIKKLFAVKVSNNSEKLIGSNRFFKQYQYLTNKISEEKSNLAKQGKLSSNKLKRMFDKRNIWQNNLYNNLVAKLFRILNKNDVDTIYVGDVKNIREDNDKGRLANTMLHNFWAYDKLYSKIGNLAEANGIKLVKVNEAYSSQTCPICGYVGEDNKQDRVFSCKHCGYLDNRDIVGANNILNIGKYGQITSILRDEIVPLGGVI